MKGSDQATISEEVIREEGGPVDEPVTYQNKRYVSSMEATWRILNFPVTFNRPSIECLPIHLEDQHRIVYNPSLPHEALQNIVEASRKTKLTAYFQANAGNVENARDVFYKNFPEHFVWDSRNRIWKKRRQIYDPPRTIGRLVTVHPSKEENFCLRQILLHFKGHTSWAALPVRQNAIQTTT